MTYYVAHVRLTPVVGTCTEKIVAVYKIEAEYGQAALHAAKERGAILEPGFEYLAALNYEPRFDGELS